MPIEFLCPRCQTAMQADDADIGAVRKCPQCQARVAVPQLPAAAPAPAPDSELAAVPADVQIEFLCPRCSTAMRAAVADAGTKQVCPGCQGKVLVPAAPAVGDETVAFPTPVESAPSGDPPWTAAADTSVLTSARRRRSSRGVRMPVVWLFPLVSLAVLAGVGWYVLRRPPEQFAGHLTANRLTDVELGPFWLEDARLPLSGGERVALVDQLETAPVRAKTTSLTMNFRSVDNRVEIDMSVSDRAIFCRVDPAKDERLARYLKDHGRQYRAAVDKDLAAAWPKFAQAIGRRNEHDHNVEGLAELRETAGMASLMQGPGFGHFVQAAIGHQAFPCLWEDTEGRLYFSLPVGTESFELVGRERPDAGRLRFTGRFTVQLSDHAITLQPTAPDGKEKVRKALNK